MESLKELLNNIKLLPNKNIIYSLIDPYSSDVRYIGKTIDLSSRIKNHYKPSRLITKTHKNNWLNKLLSENKYVNVIILEVCSDSTQLNETEIKWIKYYQEQGYDLTNGTKGGDGGKICKTAIEKMKITKAKNKQKGFWLNKNFSEEHCKNISEGKKGYIASIETRAKLSKSSLGHSRNLGCKISDEGKLNMSKAKTGIAKNTKEVYQLDLNGQIIKLWPNPYEAEHYFKLSRGKIHSVCTSKRKSTGGFKWIYKDDYND